MFEKIKENINPLIIIGAIISTLIEIGLLIAIWYELYISNCFFIGD